MKIGNMTSFRTVSTRVTSSVIQFTQYKNQVVLNVPTIAQKKSNEYSGIIYTNYFLSLHKRYWYLSPTKISEGTFGLCKLPPELGIVIIASIFLSRERDTMGFDKGPIRSAMNDTHVSQNEWNRIFKGIKNLGYENSWRDQPRELLECNRQLHVRTVQYLNNQHTHKRSYCRICNFQFFTDSSDQKGEK